MRTRRAGRPQPPRGFRSLGGRGGWKPPRRGGHLFITPLALLCLTLAGCGADEAIVTYTVPKIDRGTPTPAAAASTPAAGAAPAAPMTGPPASGDRRILAAVVQRAGDFWVVKLDGANAAVAPLVEPFNAVVRSLTFTDGGRAGWTVPDGWTEQPGDQFREAFLDPPGDGPRVAVSKLRTQGDPANFLRINVNRWLGQVGRPGATAETLGDLLETVELPDGETARVLDAATGASDAASSAGGPSPAAAAARFGPLPEFDVPDGWERGESGGSSRLNFTLPDGAEVVASEFPAGVAEAQFVQVLESRFGPASVPTPIPVGDGTGNRYAFAPPNAATVAMASRDGVLWLFRLSGPPAAVDAAEPAFENFLASLRFPEDGADAAVAKPAPATDSPDADPADGPTAGDGA